MKNIKIRLNSETSQNSVNEDSFIKINTDSKSRLLPIGEIETVINSGEQFNLERQSSSYYRLTGTINTLFNNALFNTSGEYSWTTFNDLAFKGETSSSTATNLNEIEVLTYKESILKHLKENNGWFGYYDPDPKNIALCIWKDMEPRRELFSMAPKSGVKNWELTISYPIKVNGNPGDMTHKLVKGGLLLVDINPSVIGNRNMTTFATPVKHGLSQGDTVELNGLSNENGVYTITRVGQDNGDNKEYYFSVDISGTINLTINPRMVRIFNGRKSNYYIRVFKKIGVRDGDIIEDDDYEIYPLAFSQNVYEDKTPHFVFNEDIDISGLKDNLGRPLSELYLTIIKTKSSNKFTNVKSGIKMPFISSVGGDKGIPDINRITNAFSSHFPLETDVTILSDEFYGDVIEYNIMELREKVLGDVYHTFNTINRETDSTITGTNFNDNKPLNLGIRFEGYVYKPHHKIQIKQYSNYIEQGVSSTLNKPSYTINLNDGRFIWRDLLDIGANDVQGEGLDYPFLNGAHYINSGFNLALKRQDPFNLYGLQYTSFPADVAGIILDDKIIVKRSQDVC
tara:strand:- start:1046 stop:2749 length:1704 start_codon:yes stop_codon:yes gene_type:complete